MNSCSRLVLLSICLVLCMRGGALAAQHSVTWDESTDFDSFAKSNTFKVGDQLVFKYSPGLHSVVELSSEKEYSGCDVSNAINSMSAGNDAVKLSKEGTRYFACGTPGHCGQGMKLKIKTVGANAAPTQDSSSKPSSTSASTSPILNSVTSFVALVVCTAFGFLNFV
ncbi:hypothetical protein Scep_021013 [Stephania cephalantha]|uniref:Phytocyanin domain-containing protein n=1 Tax=Stephania cephalantha TaxID=152367 RepID=A0AAP0FC32_9MAGN